MLDEYGMLEGMYKIKNETALCNGVAIRFQSWVLPSKVLRCEYVGMEAALL